MRAISSKANIEIIVFAICWRLSAFKSPSHEKSVFLKIRSFFSFNFFQGHNWLTTSPDSEFHGHWKTVTLSSISPNLSEHWRFLAFWLSLCFGSCLLFLVCHYTAFLFSKMFMLYCRLIYMLSILCVILMIKVKVGIPENFKVGWYPLKKLGRVTLIVTTAGLEIVFFDLQ